MNALRDASRVHALERGDLLLIIDRLSGRWVTVDRAYAVLVPLLGVPPPRLPDELRTPVRQLRNLLTEKGVGVAGVESHFGQLNTIILKLTNACNFACRYCYDFEVFERATVLPRELAVDAIDQALDLCESDLQVIMHGGEPTLMWDLLADLVMTGEELARTHNKRIWFVGQTNLSRINTEMVSFSREHRIAWGVSVDGPPDVHDALRVTHSGVGTYSAFEDALARFPDFVRECGIMTTVTALNQHRLLEIARHFRDLGMPSWDWSLFQPIGRGRELGGHLGLDSEVLTESWERLFQAVEAGEFNGFVVFPVKKYIDNFFHGPGGNMCMRPECGAARDLLSVSCDGTVEACDCLDPTGPLAGLGTVSQGLEAARLSPVATAIRNRDLTEAPCAQCLWFGVCGGTCLAHAPSLNSVWAEGCALAMVAFDRISSSLAGRTALVDYVDTLNRR